MMADDWEVTYFTSFNSPVSTLSTYPITGISFLTYGEFFNAATSFRILSSLSPGAQAQPFTVSGLLQQLQKPNSLVCCTTTIIPMREDWSM